jgi:hypothetical protein
MVQTVLESHEVQFLLKVQVILALLYHLSVQMVLQAPLDLGGRLVHVVQHYHLALVCLVYQVVQQVLLVQTDQLVQLGLLVHLVRGPLYYHQVLSVLLVQLVLLDQLDLWHLYHLVVLVRVVGPDLLGQSV